MRGKVISLHEGAHLDVIEGGTMPARALVQFEWDKPVSGPKDEMGEGPQGLRPPGEGEPIPFPA